MRDTLSGRKRGKGGGAEEGHEDACDGREMHFRDWVGVEVDVTEAVSM